MRLIENSEVKGCPTSELAILVRHGIDVPTLSVELNQPLIEETKPNIRLLATEIIDKYKKADVEEFHIQSSNRLRAIQTSNILVEEFAAANIPTLISETVGLRELYQGTFVIAENLIRGTEYLPFLDAWKVWQQKLDLQKQKLDTGAILYRFGDPAIDINGDMAHPELSGWFKEFGENQGEFSLRLYLFLLKTFKSTSNSLEIIVAHQSSCSRIQRIFSAASRLTGPNEFKAGDFVKSLEKRGSHVKIEPASGVIVKKPNRAVITSILEKEIEFLRSIV